MNEYFQGELIYITTGPGFQTATGDAVDPTTVKLVIGIQGETPVVSVQYPAPPLTKVSVGNYAASCDSTLWTPGVYWYKWIGTGAAQALDEVCFLVLPVNV